jgi:hypothetical protein
MGQRETDFQENFEKTTFDDKEAIGAFTSPGEIVSLRARKGNPDLFIVKIASKKQTVGPLLWSLLQQEGFGQGASTRPQTKA